MKESTSIGFGAHLVVDAAAQRLIGLIDHTALDDERSFSAAIRVCEEAAASGTAAICVWPEHVRAARDFLVDRGATHVRIASVANFPGGTEPLEKVLRQIYAALKDGATEIDVVMPYHTFRAGEPEQTETLIRACSDACRGKAVLKVILETSELGNLDVIRNATETAIRCGAQFIKTSTGKAQSDHSTAAKLEAVRVILDVIASAQRSGQHIGLKVAGGIKTLADAVPFLNRAEETLGIGWAQSTTFRIGASSLLADLEGHLGVTDRPARLRKDQAELLREHGWQYFDFHAKQRTQMFNFFLIASGVLGAAVGAMLSTVAASYVWLPLLLGALVSITFIALDKRNAQLLELAEDVLRYVEQNYLFLGVTLIRDKFDRPWRGGLFLRENQTEAQLRDAADRMGRLRKRLAFLDANRLKHKAAFRVTESAGFMIFTIAGSISLGTQLWTLGPVRATLVALIPALLLCIAWFCVLALPAPARAGKHPQPGE